jgi:ribonuclease-3 family protein
LFNIDQKLSVTEANNISPVVLAFIGDAVYSLYVREDLVFNHTFKSGELNRQSVLKVKASAQADRVNEIMPILTEEELSVYKRARNAKKTTKAKSATVHEYNMSTGFEALIGYLYITNQIDRLNYILNYGVTDEDRG